MSNVGNNNNNIRWTREEEVSLIKDIANGSSIDLLSQKHNRSSSAIELRIKKIIYENVKGGKSLHDISHLLKLSGDKTTQYYYSYKEFKEKQTGVVDNEVGKSLMQPSNPGASGHIQQPNQFNQSNKAKQFVPYPQLQQSNLQQPAQFGQQGGNQENQTNVNVEKAFHEPNNLEKIESKLRRLEMENRILKLVVENKELTQQLNKLIKEGKVDPSIKTLIKVFRKSI